MSPDLRGGLLEMSFFPDDDGAKETTQDDGRNETSDDVRMPALLPSHYTPSEGCIHLHVPPRVIYTNERSTGDSPLDLSLPNVFHQSEYFDSIAKGARGWL